jgi:hypothetical protein
MKLIIHELAEIELNRFSRLRIRNDGHSTGEAEHKIQDLFLPSEGWRRENPILH